MNRTILTLALAACAANAQAQTLNGLCVYLEYQVLSRSMAPRHWYFLPDGRYLNDAPLGELTPKGLDLACAKYPAECGKYTLAGNKLNLNPLKGKPWTADFKPSSTPGHLDINNIPCQKVTASYPANAKLNGRYTAGAGFGGVRSVRTYTFKPDGTFSVEAIGAVSNSATSAVSTSAQSGTYRLAANSLELASNGQTSKHLIYELPAGPDKVMVIDGVSWKKQ